VIVVATEDFEVYHEVVAELRDRDVEFTTVEPGDDLPEATRVVVTGGDDVDYDAPVVEAAPGRARRAVEAALTELRGGDGRTVVGVDPGTRPGIAVLRGGMVVAAFQVPADEAADVVSEEVADAENPVVRIGDGARLEGARVVDELDDVRVELVDETGTTPYLGPGARGMGDVLAAANIALMPGEEIEGRRIEPTEGEIEVIKARSREASEENRTITAALARRVAAGELTLEEALAEHRAED
jgi:membrane-associated protease RseP (regulator of RpoE activity)